MPAVIAGVKRIQNRSLSMNVEMLIAGNEAAFDELVQETRGLLMSIAMGFLMDREAAKDAVQDCYLRFWRARGKLDPSGNVKAYLAKILRNVCLTVLKKRRPQVSMEQVPEPHVSEDRADRFALRDALGGALAVLNEGEREIVALVHYMGLDSKEVGKIMGQSDSTIRSRYQAARIRMRNFIIRYYPEFAGGI